MIKNLIFIFSLFILSSCSKTPEITYISNIEMSGIEGDTIKAQSVVTISNPNLYSISLDNVIMNFCYDSVIIGKGIVDEKIRLKKSNTDVLVNSNISIKELYKTMPKVFETDSFQLTINVLAELSFFKININRKIKTYINTKQIINSFLSQENIENNISINSISVSSIGYDSTELFFNIKVVNFLPFSYVINKIKVDIYNDIDESILLGTSTSENINSIKKDSTINTPFKIKVSNANTVKTMFFKFLTMDNYFYLDGIANVSIGKYNFPVPIKTKIKIPIH